MIIVLSGPSGVGKDTVVRELKARGFPLHHVITATTRPPRPGEREGQDYYFLSPAQFQEMQDRGELVEWAQVYGHWYGVPKGEVEKAAIGGEDVLIKVDVQGAATLRRLYPQAVLILLVPPDVDELLSRLRHRHTESDTQLQVRLEKVRGEMAQLHLFDYKVVNSRVEEAVAHIEAIITAEKCRLKH